MTEHKKIIFSCFLIFAVLGFAIFNQLLKAIAEYFDFYVYGYGVEVAVRLIPLVIGGGIFWGLYNNTKSYVYATEVVQELKKVTWPKSLDVRSATIVVIIAVILAGSLLGLIDTVWSYIIRNIIGYFR
ncbi:MAG: preprotein translocase subunit SecE [Deltaproteobacteria bacterium]|nr:preprotein translocase subunit SecE [Deltaproteobacteria bacterium]